MTRKDYILIASVIRDLALDEEQKEHIIRRFIAQLKADNPNFEPVRFRKMIMENNGNG